jgi:hypothetical protein
MGSKAGDLGGGAPCESEQRVGFILGKVQVGGGKAEGSTSLQADW